MTNKTAASRAFLTYLRNASSVVLLLALLVCKADASSSTDGSTPLALSPGAPTGSYPLGGLDNINFYNGSLNFRLPLLGVGGRGGAGYTITQAIEQHWRVDHWTLTDGREVHTPLYNPWSGLVPGYSPGALYGRQVNGGWCSQSYPSTDTLTRLTFVAPDGTEYELVDKLTGGQAQTSYCWAGNGFARGTVFVTADGTSATFVSDTTIYDHQFGSAVTIYPSGYFLLRDGTRYRIDSGRVTWLRDRNGNKLTFTYSSSQTVITDSLNRQVVIDYNVSDVSPYGLCDKITYNGFESVPRVIRVSKTNLGNVLRSGYSLQTPAALFPGLDGSSSTYHNPQVISAVWQPDGRSYKLFYNSYGELARAELPTGGAFEYDWGGGVINGNVNGLVDVYNATPPTTEIYRRVIERRVYKDGSTLEGKITVSRTDGLSVANVHVTVDNITPAGALINRSKHYFYGNPVASFAVGAMGYPQWKHGREYKTESFDANGTTLLRRVENTWQQPVFGSTWPLTQPETQDWAKINNPQITQTVTTLADTNQVAQQTFAYDLHNNQTDIYEYDYGVGAAGAIVRRTHTDYLTTNSVNGADYASANPTVNSVHIRSLPAQQQVFQFVNSNWVERARNTYEYDNYATDTYHALLVDRPGITGLDPAYTNSYQTRGNNTRVSRWILSSGTSINTYAQYDVAGNSVKAINGRGLVSEVGYSSTYQYAYPTSTTSPIPDPTGTYGTNTPLTTSTSYDFSTGLVTSTTDPNGQTTTIEYNDVLNRPTAILRPDGGRTRYTYVDVHQCGPYVETRTLIDTRETDEYVFFDGLGRSVRAFKYEGQDANNPYITTDTQYDALGRARRVSNPYRSAGCTAAVNPSGNWTTSNYDALSRVTSVTTPDAAAVTTTYSGNQMTVTDQAGKARRSVTDGLGRLTSVIEDPNGLAYQTGYSYDVLGNLSVVTQGTQHRYFMYDSLSRLIRAKNPEQDANSSLALADPVSGNSQWSIGYTYDNNSNLLTRTDARNVTATYTYDNLNRMTLAVYSDGTHASIFAYDMAANGRGRFYYDYDNSTSGGFSFVTNYDSVGRPTRRQTDFYLLGTGWVGSYVSTRAYNKAGNVVSQTYPSGRAVSYSYDQMGRTQSFTGNLGDGVARTYAAAISYNEWGGLSREQYGTGTALYRKSFYNVRGQLFDTRLSSVNDMWDWNRGRLILYYSSNHVWGGSGTDNNGNIRFAENWVPPPNAALDQAEALTEDAYTYDSLNRISSVSEQRMSVATGWGNWAQQFAQVYAYDRYGNRTINGSQTWGVGVNSQQFTVDANTNKLGVPSGQTGVMQYDANGNLINDTYSGMGTRTYDAENRMTSAWGNGGVQSVYTYDASGRRTRRNTGGATTWQIYGIDGELLAEYAQGASPSQPQKEYGYRSGELLVTAASNADVRWLVPDHLGTPRMIADKTGSLAGISRHDYLPFGEELYAGTGGRTTAQGYSGSDSVRQKFTQYERDNETGLDYAGARYYGSAMGRFTSHDPLLASGKPASPQSWNRYAYVGNNPLAYVDPDGMLAVPINDEEEQRRQRQQQSQQQQPPPAPSPASSTSTQVQTPTDVIINAPQPNTMVNIPVNNDLYFTGVGSIIQLTPTDENGNPISNVAVLESVSPSTITQNPEPVMYPNGVVQDLVARGTQTPQPLTLQQAGSIIVPILATPHTVTQEHRMLIVSPSSGVAAIATHTRTLTNVDAQGNLRPFVNPQTGRSQNNFTLTVSPVQVTQRPLVMSPRIVF